MIVNLQTLPQLDFAKMDALLPAVVQHAKSGAVLMVAWMNEAALRNTLQDGYATFWSRSRQCLWQKGETSGNRLQVIEISADCDRDTLLLRVLPAGPVCHTGAVTCFDEPGDTPIDREESSDGLLFLGVLERIVAARASENSERSYTARLLQSGAQRVAQKVGEEGVELALAAVSGQREEIVSESADLLYHLIVLLRSQQVSLVEVTQELQRRHAEKR
jgi:phosphoribosyl-ATP pyrophosphohydrolase/phosphoribosyl-AMP cyclohydrolase